MGREVLGTGGVGRMSGKRESRRWTWLGGLRLRGAERQGGRLHAGVLRPPGQGTGGRARGHEGGRKLAVKGLLVSWGHCDQSPQSWWLSRTDVYSLLLLEPRSLQSLSLS